jgi:hypothetical protein
MHKLLDYICTELESLEDKADRNGSLTMTEIQYADTLLHMKKNLLKSEELSEGGDYGRSYGARGRGSNARRDSRGRYADRGDMVDTIRDMMRDAPDDTTRMEFQRFIDKIDRR